MAGIWDTLSWLIFFIVFSYVYPRFMLAQMVHRLEDAVRKFEEMENEALEAILKRVGKRKKKRVQEFGDLFVVMPSSLDPFGIVRKIDSVLRGMEKKIYRFASSISPEPKRVDYSLRAYISARQLRKVLRHFVEVVKKYKNLQVGFLIQMQLPVLQEIMRSQVEGVKAFLDNVPVGDSIGPLVAASFMKKPKEIAEGVVYDKVRIAGRTAFVLKARGPEPELGRMDEAIKRLLKFKPKAVITIDAALKLEGEKSGSVAEGVGFAMGGIAQREIIENILLPKNIPLESVVCKIGMKEGISPMKKEVFDSLPRIREKVEEIVKQYGSPVIIVGVGNTVGVGNEEAAVAEAKKKLRKFWRAEKGK